MKYADIIVDISVESIDKIYQYKIPEELKNKAVIGAAVVIPFGRGNRKINGYIVGLSDDTDFDERLIKSIEAVDENKLIIESQLIMLAAWIKRHYGATMNEALKTVMPIKRQVKEVEKKTIYLNDKEKADIELENAHKKNHMGKVRFFSELFETESLDREYCIKNIGISSQILSRLEKGGIIRIEAARQYRNPIGTNIEIKDKKILNEYQQSIADDIIKNYKNKDLKPCLIHGITGSGKTEIYLEIIEEVIKDNKQVIMLIPEISLTFQTVRRFYERFGDRVSILNSKMSYGERYDQSERAKNGDIDIIIGPRSALFTPFKKLGLIIIDEEHESSYKSEMPPKYHARETAAERARVSGAMLVLGSATPSLEAYSRAKNGEYRLYKLDIRANGANMPSVSIVDLRKELKEGNKTIFSRLLAKKINDRLEKKQQIMLFLNRRGYAGQVSCRSCGNTIMCPHCDVSLTLHGMKRLVCHYCGYEITKPDKCPVCDSNYIDKFGIGTQKVEELTKKYFPNARIIRMDADTTRTKESYEKILSIFSEGEADILIGTQMIVKGHDFPKVTLVGILAADMSLHAADYRASEKTFQLITQASGRAGRANLSGEVVLQTYSPEHSAIQCAACADYEKFFSEESAYRKLAGYPPSAHILSVFFMSANETKLDKAVKIFADKAKALLAKYLFTENMPKNEINKNNMLTESVIRKNMPEDLDMDKNVQIIGPAPAAIGKINDVYRRVIYFKNKDEEVLIFVKDYLEAYIVNSEEYSGILVQFDMDPVS